MAFYFSNLILQTTIYIGSTKKVAPRFARRLFLLLVLMLGRLTSVDLRSYFELAINDNRAQLASQGILQTAQ